jgi:AraC-like DNA-binding protein
MKVLPFTVPKTSKEAFRLQVDIAPYLYDKLHQHPEIQMMLIEQGEGTLIAGDYVGRFHPGNMFILGSNLPHVFRNDENYYKPKSKLRAHAISIYFNESYFGEKFWQLDELSLIRNLSSKAERGLAVKGKLRASVTELIYNIQQQNGLPKLILFLQMLKVLTESSELTPLSVSAYTGGYTLQEGKRMNDILQFTFRESYRKIYIDEVAQVANLSTEAFCRYFKLRTMKTYTNFLNEVRISQACKLLIQKEVSIQEICQQSGFSNLSNFNRIFRKVTGKTPTTYLQ